MFSIMISLFIGALVIIGNRTMLGLLFGRVEDFVMEACVTYLRIYMNEAVRFLSDFRQSLYLLHKLFRCLRKYLIFFPDNAHVIFPFGRESGNTDCYCQRC